MKLKYILTSLAFAGLLLTGCEDNDYDPDVLDNLQVSNSYLTFSGTSTESQTITLTATESWYFVTDSDECATFGLDTIPGWLSISPLYGDAGEYSLALTATEYDGTDSAVIGIRVGTTTQFFNVSIGEATDPDLVTIAEVLAGQDGVTYRTAGYCTLIVNTTYGNWYLTDDNGDQVYIYGTVDSGGSYNWSGIGIELGDYVVVQGPRSTYGTTIELVDVSVIDIIKNLISVETEAEQIPLEGGEAEVVLSVSGNGLTVTIPDEAKSWLSVSGISETTDSTSVIFYAAANDGAARSATVGFSTVSGGTTYSTETTIYQAGAIVDAVASEINAAEDGGQYRITGYISTMASTTYGNYYLTDYSGTVYVYGTLDADGNSKNFSSLGINEGDIVTVYGEKSSYGDVQELVNVTVESFYSVTDLTIAEFNAAEEADDVYYRISGTVTSISNPSYGNLYIEDETGDSVYIYGLLSGWGGGSKSFADLDPAIEVGDEITAVGIRDSYGSTIEMTGGFLVAHTQGSDEGDDDGDDEGDDDDDTSTGTTYTQVTSSTISDGTYLIVASEAYAATALASSYSYGYLQVTSVTVSDGVITSEDLASCEFVITSTDSGYTIMDSESRYLYQSGSYNTFNVATTEPTEGQYWTITAQSDGTYQIMNTNVSKYIQYSSTYTSFGSYSGESGAMPALYLKSE